MCLSLPVGLSWVGSRSPDGWDQMPYRPGGWFLHQPPWSFGFNSQTRGTRENRRCTDDRREKRNVLIVSVLLPIGGDAARQYAEARLCPEGATGTRSAARGCLTQTCHGRCASPGHSCRERPARAKWGVCLIPKRLTASSVARPRTLAHGVRWRAPAQRACVRSNFIKVREEREGFVY